MADDTQQVPGDAGKPDRPHLYSFEELAALAANNPLPRGRCLVQVDDTGDLITAWLDALSVRHPRAGRGRRGAEAFQAPAFPVGARQGRTIRRRG
ncbi:MAG: hypothetical protein ACJ8AW_29745 [Rhodopila sp.]